MVNIYPYYTYTSQPHVIDPNAGISYANLFDTQLDARRAWTKGIISDRSIGLARTYRQRNSWSILTLFVWLAAGARAAVIDFGD
jgi:hypothetical protein